MPAFAINLRFRYLGRACNLQDTNIEHLFESAIRKTELAELGEGKGMRGG